MPKLIENYIFEILLGSGQYGKVYKAKNLETSEYFAIKTIKISHLQKLRLENTIQNELTILQSISSPHIVRFFELKQNLTHYYLIYEYCNGGTLETYLKSNPNLQENEALSLFNQILAAFKVLASKGIVHRDIKPSNIIFHNGVLKIADFGFSKILKQPNELMETMVGSPIYMAPEILQGHAYDKKSDIWSLGVVLYQLVFGKVPFEEKSLVELIKRTGNFDKEELLKGRKPGKTVDLLGKILEKDPNKRVDWENLFRNAEELKEKKPEIGLIHEKTFQILNLERTKIQYLYEVLEEMLKLKISEDLGLFSVLMGKIWYLARKIKENLIDNFRKEEFPYLLIEKERALEIRKTDSFERWARIFSGEYEKIERNYKVFQAEIGIQTQDRNEGYDENVCHKKLLDYCILIKERTLKGGMERDWERRVLIHLNMVLEVINVHEFVQTYFELGKNLRNQRYFEILKSYEIGSLRNVIMNKLALYKGKFKQN